ncbi:MAG: hypothetical protein J5785_06250 [Spirochaetales bacterium]|nr:hypothetical protein [Spirochaetales bacterium]
MAYYSRFELLCIDEFPNSEAEDNGYMMQEFFNIRNIRGFSTIVIGKPAPSAQQALSLSKMLRTVDQGKNPQECNRT